MSFTLPCGISRPSVNRSMTAAVEVVDENHTFLVPTKLIKIQPDMKIWEKSEAYCEFLGFILTINDSIKGKSNSQGSENVSQRAINIVQLLEKLDALVDETPPIQQPQRFGNVAFKTWYIKMKHDVFSLIQEALSQTFNKAIPEIVSYLVDAFGNPTRIDYGTGHEISFVMFLCCLFKIGFLKDADRTATGCYIFPKYLDLSRKLQKTYRMEPAGSHGVWSLDDYQFIPFIWGSSQLFAHPVIEPAQFLNPQILNDYGEDFMFLTCIQYINSVKTGPFAEHSNQLWSISGVSSWGKINGGLIKMYKAEVLSKFPVVQHIVFGSLFTLKPVEQAFGMIAKAVPSVTLSHGASESPDVSRGPSTTQQEVSYHSASPETSAKSEAESMEKSMKDEESEQSEQMSENKESDEQKGSNESSGDDPSVRFTGLQGLVGRRR